MAGSGVRVRVGTWVGFEFRWVCDAIRLRLALGKGLDNYLGYGWVGLGLGFGGLGLG